MKSKTSDIQASKITNKEMAYKEVPVDRNTATETDSKIS